MGKFIILSLLVVLLMSGCGDRQDVLTADQVVSVETKNVLIPIADGEQLILDLVADFNNAEYQRSGKSGPPTHSLVLRTVDGAQYTLYRINEEVVEVGLRHDDLRKKFFLTSPAFSQQVQDCAEQLTEASP